MGFPPWCRGPLLHRGGEAAALPFGRPQGSNPVVDITLLDISNPYANLSNRVGIYNLVKWRVNFR